MNPNLQPKSDWQAFCEGFIAGGIGALLTLCVFLALAAVAHCETTKPRHDNAFGAIIAYENPYIYNFGAIIDGALIDHGRATSIRFQPYGTFELYNENILFCGNQARPLRTATGPIVLTYKRVAHETVDGIGCHELESIDHIQDREGQ